MTIVTQLDERLSGLRRAVRERLARIVNLAQANGTLNRADIFQVYEVSVPTASHDIREIMTRFPDLLVYDASAKTYRLRGDAQ